MKTRFSKIIPTPARTGGILVMDFMKKHQIFLLGCLLAVLLGASCSAESAIKHYSGDGKIEANPDYGFWGGGNGYTLKCESIKLDRQIHVVYHFVRLPHWKSNFYFVIEDPRRWQSRREYKDDRQEGHLAKTNNSDFACLDDLTSVCHMLLKDADNKVILQFNKKLSELIWSQSSQGRYDLYDPKAINFTPDSREYTLEIIVDPEPLLKNDPCYILVQGGGHEPISIGF